MKNNYPKTFMFAVLALFCFGGAAMANSWTYGNEQQRQPYAGGAGTKAAPYVITSAQQLADLSWNVNHGTTYQGAYFKLGGDIDLNPGYTFCSDGTFKGGYEPRQWVPIGSGSGNAFMANFDGDGHAVTGLYQQDLVAYKENFDTRSNMGLFGIVKGDTLSNVCIKNSLISLECQADDFMINVGAVAGTMESGAVYNCTNDAAIVFHCIGGIGGSSVGGIVGSCSNGDVDGRTEIVGCRNNGYIYVPLDNYALYVGGIVGYLYGNLRVSDCRNNADIAGGGNYMGGILGYTVGFGNQPTEFSNLVNVGAVTSNGGSAAGLVGEMNTSSNDMETARNCVNKGNISGYDAYGLMSQVGCLFDSYNEGKITGADKASGLLGTVQDRYLGMRKLNNVYNAGDVESDGAAVAGIVIDIKDYINGQTAELSNLFNYGSLKVNGSFAGGINPIVGSYSPYTHQTFDNCYYLEQEGVAAPEDVALPKSQEEFASGSVCVLLNKGQNQEPWGQKVGTDPYPLLNGAGSPGVSGIGAVTATMPRNTGYYDLGGRRLPDGKKPHGLYIVNGKKVVVRQ